MPSGKPEGFDQAILGYYDRDKEDERLFVRLGPLERMRTQELVRRHAPPAPARVLDVGGGTGVYAEWLAGLGYQVHLIDPVELHVERAAARAAGLQPSFTVALGDARRLTEGDTSFDVVLMSGPLYHLVEAADRRAALAEARRVLRPGGTLMAVAISKFAPLLDGLREGWLNAPDFVRIVERDLADGQHRNPSDRPDWFTTAYLHHPHALAREVSEAGFSTVRLFGVEGPGWARNADWNDEGLRAQLMYAARAVETEPSLLGLSPHTMAVAVA